MARNLRNNGYAEGRLTRDITVFKNEKDGSHKVMLTLAISNNFKNAKGEKESQFINFQAYLAKEVKVEDSVYNFMKKGDLVGIGYSARSNNYTDKNGQMVYDQILFIEDVDLKETKASQAARAANVVADNETGAEPAEMPKFVESSEQPF